MINTKLKIYCLLLALLICAASANLSVGNTYARYNNTVSVSTVLESPSPEMESNCLAMKNEAPVTVLAGELPMEGADPVQVRFSVTSAEDVERYLIRSVKAADYAGYVNVTTVCDGKSVTANEKVKLTANTPSEVTVTVTPTPFAKTQAHEELEIDIAVVFGDLMGTIRVILPEVEESSVSGSGSQSGSANSPENGGENTGSEGETGEDIVTPTEPDVPAETEEDETGEETETPESDITAQAFSRIPAAFSGISPMQTDTETDAVNDETETGSGTEEETESSGTDDETKAPDAETGENTESPEGSENPEFSEGEAEENEGTNEETVEPGTSSGDNQYEAGGSGSWVGTENAIKTVKSFDPKQKIPVMLTRTGAATSVRLGIYKETLAAFPDYTRLSLDNGESWYVIFNGHIPQFAVNEITGALLLDFSNANLGEAGTVTFAMEAFAGETSAGFCKTEAAVSNMNICETTVISGTAEMQIAAETETEGPETQKRVLASGESLLINFPAEWIPEGENDYSFEYTVDLLTLSENEPRTLVRSPVIPSDVGSSGITTIYTADAESKTHNLVFQVTEELPQAGTYVVNLKWNYQGICFYETRITFFINYSAQTDYPSGS